MKVRGFPLVAAALCMLAASEARAQRTCSPPSGVTTCLPSDNLWPSARGPFTWLAASDTLPSGKVSFGATTSWIYRPIGLEVASADPAGTRVYPVEHAVSLHLVASAGLGRRVTFDVAAPFIAYQTGAGTGFLTGDTSELPRSASGELRFGPTVALLRSTSASLSARAHVVAPTGSPGAFATYGETTVAPGVSGNLRLGRWGLGADLGARLRGPVEYANAVVGSQLTVGLGATFEVLPERWLTASAEAFALVGLTSQYDIGFDATGENRTGYPHIPAEWLVSFATRRLLDGKVGIRIGAGGSVPTGPASAVTAPAMRTVASVTIAP